jgi:hypothetical protein
VLFADVGTELVCSVCPHAKIIESKNLREMAPERKHYIQ